MFTKIGKEISKITLNFFYLLAPNHCLACSGTVEKKEGVLCSFCRNAIQKLNIHLKGDNFVANRI